MSFLFTVLTLLWVSAASVVWAQSSTPGMPTVPTNCPVDGRSGLYQPCYELDTNAIYVCERPEAGGEPGACDQPGEWDRATGGGGGGGVGGSSGGFLYVEPTPLLVVNTTTETSLLPLTLPAGSLTATSCLTHTVYGVIASSGTNTFTFRAKFGPQVLTLNAVPSSSGANPLKAEYEICGHGTASAQEVRLTLFTSALAYDGTQSQVRAERASFTIDVTADQYLDLTVQMDTADPLLAVSRTLGQVALTGFAGVVSFEGRIGPVVSAVGDYTAAEVANVPAGTIAATTTQAALNELDTEKQPRDDDLTTLASKTVTGTGSEVRLSNGAFANNDCVRADNFGNFISAGTPCGVTGGGGVTSFNARTGAVVPANGDYSAVQITTTPFGSLSSPTQSLTNAELDAEKQPIDADLTTLAGKNILGTGTDLRMSSGSFATNDCVKVDLGGSFVSAGAACGTTTGSGPVPPLSAVADIGRSITNAVDLSSALTVGDTTHKFAWFCNPTQGCMETIIPANDINWLVADGFALNIKDASGAQILRADETTRNVTVATQLVISGGLLTLGEVTAPSAPASGNQVLYAKTGGVICGKTSAGTETCMGGGGVGSGTVTSVAITVPSELSVSGSPITTSGTIAITEATQTANTIYAGPTSGGAAAPGYRALVDNDIPDALTASNYLPLSGGTLTGSLTAPSLITNGAGGGLLTLTEAAAPGSPTAGTQSLYAKTGGTVCSKNSAGTETCMGGGVGSGDIESVGSCASGPCFQSETTNKVLASPDGSTGQMTSRALVANDLPTVTVAKGGTGITSGTSGGIPYYSATSTIASSGALTVGMPVIGGGAGAAPTVGTRSGNTTTFVTTTGTQTSGRCVEIDASGNHIAAAGACVTGVGSGDVVGPASSIDNELARFDSTTGKLIQGGSAITVGDTGDMQWTDATLSRFAANAMMLRNASTTQKFMVARNYTSASVYESFSVLWSTDIAMLRTEHVGGSLRNLALAYANSVNQAVTIPSAATLPIDLAASAAATAASSGQVRISNGAVHGATSGNTISTVINPTFQTSSTATTVGIGLRIAPTINYTNATPGTGHYETLQIAAIETDLQTGTNLLIAARAGTTGVTDKFLVDNTGKVTAAGGYVSGANTGVTLNCTAMPTTMTITGGIITAVSGGTCS